MITSGDYGDAPRQTADGNGFHRLLRRHVDDRHVIREAVCNIELAAVGAERELPWPLAHQDVPLDVIRPGIHHGNPIGAPQRHERRAPVGGELHADRSDVLLVDAGNIEVDDVYDLMASRVDDRDRPADLRRCPQIPLIRGVYDNPRPGIDEDVGHDLPGPGIDEMRHAGLLGDDHHGAPVPPDGETFGLYPDRNLRDPLARREVDHRDQGVVLIRYVDPVAGHGHRQRFGVRTGVYLPNHLQRLRIDDVDIARVPIAHQHGPVIRGLDDSPGSLVGWNRRDHFVAVTVEYRHRIVDFVRDEELAAMRSRGE